MAAASDYSEYLNVKVMDGATEMAIMIKGNTKLITMGEAWCNRRGKLLGTVRFLYLMLATPHHNLNHPHFMTNSLSAYDSTEKANRGLERNLMQSVRSQRVMAAASAYSEYIDLKFMDRNNEVAFKVKGRVTMFRVMAGDIRDTPSKKPESEYINLTVMDGHNEVVIRVKRTVEMIRLMEASCYRRGKILDTVRSLYDGVTLQGTDSPNCVCSH